MGQAFDRDSYSQDERALFKSRLEQQIMQLREELTEPAYSQCPTSIGAELELYVVDKSGQPAPINMELIEQLNDPLLQEELNKFNLEFNLSPVAAKGKPFAVMQKQLLEKLAALKKLAKSHDTEIVSIGILPTLKESHLASHFMTDLPRYRALTRELSELRGESFKVNIHGQDVLKLECDEVTLEGANTSFQLHLTVPANQFVDHFNAAQLITPLVMAVSGNSPLFLGKRLWQETRIALFKQSIDNRIHELTRWRQPSRVTYGHGWVRKEAWELFAENVAMYPPLLPFVCEDERPYGELLIHHGTVWNWNRAILKPKPDPHLRIEFRTFPAGPTSIDMMANSALAIGLTKAFSHCIDLFISQLPFEYSQYNFYRAAQEGLDAKLLWPETRRHRPKETPVHRILQSLLPMAEQGLQEIGIESSEISLLLGVIENRINTRQTGSHWQLRNLEKHMKSLNQSDALQAMLFEYMHQSDSNKPVAEWGDL